MTEGLGNPAPVYSRRISDNTAVSLIFRLDRKFGNVGIAVGRLASLAAIFLSVFYIEMGVQQRDSS